MNSLLSLRFEAREGRTVLRLDSQQPPWRVVRAFPNSCGEALIHLHNVSGGVLTNDDLRLQVDVGPEARAQITTAGATRVYRSRAAGATARQQNVVTVRERGLLEYVPDALIPYAGSRFEQSTAIGRRPERSSRMTFSAPRSTCALTEYRLPPNGSFWNPGGAIPPPRRGSETSDISHRSTSAGPASAVPRGSNWKRSLARLRKNSPAPVMYYGA